MEREITLAVEQLLSSYIWMITLIFVVSFVFISLIKQTATNAFEYILIKTDLFGVGSLVYYNGKKARIVNIGFRRTKLYMIDSKETVNIRTINWRKFELIEGNKDPNV